MRKDARSDDSSSDKTPETYPKSLTVAIVSRAGKPLDAELAETAQGLGACALDRGLQLHEQSFYHRPQLSFAVAAGAG